MLHRTRANQVLPIYEEFIRRYPNLGTAANAPSDEIAQVMSPLGLRWRVNLVPPLLRQIQTAMDGEVPTSREILRTLPGINDYIAGAVPCFSADLKEVILDTNIVRVVGRVTGERVTDASRRNVRFRALVRRLLPSARVREFYFALIDLAAAVCTPRDPLCPACPLVRHCSWAARVTQHARAVRHRTRQGSPRA